MRLIDADALEKDGWMMHRTVQVDKDTMSYQTKKPTDFPTIEPEPCEDVPDTNVGDMKSCIYCHEDSDGYVAPIEKNCHAFIRFGMNGCELSLKAKGWHGSAKIRYCPMCGRRLTDG